MKHTATWPSVKRESRRICEASVSAREVAKGLNCASRTVRRLVERFFVAQTRQLIIRGLADQESQPLWRCVAAYLTPHKKSQPRGGVSRHTSPRTRSHNPVAVCRGILHTRSHNPVAVCFGILHTRSHNPVSVCFGILHARSTTPWRCVSAYFTPHETTAVET